eukprot:TRINITY_DN6782_c0_g1_i1.p1 TRINITY_DN6782_c0_g1~~TRINITY_DN6782_c0_g1_i1.p1  ORF type:complete len:517 (-),score=113.22 TRINITY_DN6782_c0_g1_i1:54-1604(-)
MNGTVERQSEMSAAAPVPIESGLLIKDRWRVIKSIGKGAFGEIFAAEDLEMGCNVGIKVERIDSKKRVLKIEVAVLKKLQPCPFVCRYHQFGRHEDFYFVVMQLLGENLSVLRKRQPGKRFTIGTTCRLGVQMLSAIENMHDFGYLHRDIKPSNFAMGLNAEAKEWCFLIDFGLARRFTLPNGDIRTARDSAGFRGTARYASINSHLSKELARRDDMWSLFYLIIEFMKGSLPWSSIENKEDVGRRKIELDTPSLVDGLPAEMALFMDHLRMLEYRHRPDYDYINSLFNQMLENAGIPDDEPYDWDKSSNQQHNGSVANDINSAMHDVGRSGAPDSRIPRPRTAGRSEHRPRESPHDKANSVDTSKLDPNRSSQRGASANKNKSSKRGSARNTSAKRQPGGGVQDPQGSSATGLGFEEHNGSSRPARSNRGRARTKRSDEPPLDVVGLDNQGSSDPTKRTLMRGKNRNSPMTNSGYQDNDTIGACLLYTSDAADEEDSVDLGGRRIIKKKKIRDEC